MTIEELLNCPASFLEESTEAQWLEWFGPKLLITRPTPELRARNMSAARKKQVNAAQQIDPERMAQLKKAQAIAASMGISTEGIDLFDNLM